MCYASVCMNMHNVFLALLSEMEQRLSHSDEHT